MATRFRVEVPASFVYTVEAEGDLLDGDIEDLAKEGELVAGKVVTSRVDGRPEEGEVELGHIVSVEVNGDLSPDPTRARVQRLPEQAQS